MPHLTLPLHQDGPIIDLFVGVSEQRTDALVAAKQPVPELIKVRAIIDTGASGTLINADSLKPLGLVPTGQTMMHTPSTAGKGAPCFLYDVWLGIAHPKQHFIIGNKPIMTSNLAGTGIEALIGQDVLSNCLFSYDGSSRTFTLAF